MADSCIEIPARPPPPPLPHSQVLFLAASSYTWRVFEPHDQLIETGGKAETSEVGFAFSGSHARRTIFLCLARPQSGGNEVGPQEGGLVT